MCFNVSITKKADEIEELFNARFIQPELFQPIYHVSAFSKPVLPVITSNSSRHIQLFQWGLIPSWVKDIGKAEEIRFQTGNARDDTIFEKPSFRGPIMTKRCLVPVDGFYEWQEVRGKNYPHYIHLLGRRAFALAGIWDRWRSPPAVNTDGAGSDTGTMHQTFSIITTKANSLMERIHNKKKRMPVILQKRDYPAWLDDSLDVEEITRLMQPYDEYEMIAYPVSRLISRRDVDNNVPGVMEPHTYSELLTKDLFSF
jgi:putative SOS response-associated peptidase YedK